MLGELAADVVARVVAFVERHVLPLPREIHAHGFGRPEGIVADGTARLLYAAAQHGVDSDGALGGVLQLEVDGHVVGELLTLQGLDGLMVLQHLHGGDVGGVDVVGGQSVAPLQEVHVLHVEVLDAFAVELDGAALRHLYARHAFQHVTDDTVALLGV